LEASAVANSPPAASAFLRVPEGGEVLEHVATLAAPIAGQAVGLDPKDPRRLYGINRARRQVVAMRLPKLADR
jgi:hypothetical protein